MLQFVVIIFFELMSDYFLCSPSVSQTPRKAEANHLVKMWYGFSLFVPSVVCFSSTSPMLFTCDMLVVCATLSFFLGGSSSSHDWWDFGGRNGCSGIPRCGKGGPSGGITEEAGQPM